MRYVFPATVGALAFVFYVTTQSGISWVRIVSKSFAASAVVLLAVTLGISGLALFFPTSAKSLTAHKKTWGLIGFGFALLHAGLAFSDPLMQNVSIALSRYNVRLGLMALLVFAALAVTSNKVSKRILGDHWKDLQRAGYVGLGLVFADLLVLGDGTFIRTPIGGLLLIVVLAALAFGIYHWFQGRKQEGTEIFSNEK